MRSRIAATFIGAFLMTSAHAGVRFAPDVISEQASYVLGSRLRTELSAWERAARPSLASRSNPFLRVDDTGRIFVTVSYEGASAPLVDWLSANGAEVVNAADRWHLLETWVSPTVLTEFAEQEQVRTVRAVERPVTRTGSKLSEGVAILNADSVQALGYDGTGVKIGVLSDGVDNLSSAQATGDVPSNVTVLTGFGGEGDEGTAMLEIVHDVAPGAELAFASAWNGQLEYVRAIRELAAAGCDVLVDDIGYYAEPEFEDGPIAQIADSVNSEGICYYAAAGNSGDREHWEGEFVAADENNWHAWDGASDTTLALRVEAGDQVYVVLKWNDRWGASANDYDLYLSRSASFDDTRLVDVGGDWQNGEGDGYESVSYTNDAVFAQTLYVGVHLFAGEQKYLDLIITGASDVEYWQSEGSIWGHPNARGVMAVGAIHQQEFDSSADPTIADFSSRGPANIYFPQREIRAKPDITGIDGVSITGAGGFGSAGRFYGTSAAAPHIAGLAGLILDAHPDWRADEVNAALLGSAVDYGDAGPDLTYGYGLADVLAAVNATEGTEVGGTVTTTTWYKPNGPYIVTDTVRVPVGETLTIEPGVDIVFAADVPFIVEGALVVEGAKADSVRFYPDTDATAAWGGLRFSGANGDVRYARISGARALSDGDTYIPGGGISASDGSVLKLEHVALMSNSADSLGGGLGAADASIDASHVAFVGNEGPLGGGIYLKNTGAVLRNVTMAGNTAVAGSAIAAINGAVQVDDAILWGNTGGDAVFIDGGSVAVNTSLVEGGYGGDGNTDVDPLFANLPDGDIRLGSGSPAIDAGDVYGDLDPDGTRLDLGAVPSERSVVDVLGLDQLDAQLGSNGVSFPIYAIGENISSVVLSFLMDADLFTPSADFIASDGFSGASNEDAWTWSVSGDTVRVQSVPDSLDAASFDGESMLVLRFDVASTGPQDETLGLYWLPFPATRVNEQVSTLVSGWISLSAGPNAIATSESVPAQFSLEQNAPNPFNPTTSIRFTTTASSGVNLSIWSANGQLVRTLIDGTLTAGAHEVVWDGLDSSGRQVASGVYMYRLTATDGTSVRRMTLVR